LHLIRRFVLVDPREKGGHRILWPLFAAIVIQKLIHAKENSLWSNSQAISRRPTIKHSTPHHGSAFA
jgi:hypothetical protein